MIEKIDLIISKLLIHRDSDEIKESLDVRALICTTIEKAYFLESIILSNKTFSETSVNQFFSAKSSVNRYFRDRGFDEVADLYNKLCDMANPYLDV